jgi:hypothetical protein
MLGRRDDLLERIAGPNRLTERPGKFAGSPFRNASEDLIDGSRRFRIEASRKISRLSVLPVETENLTKRAGPLIEAFRRAV